MQYAFSRSSHSTQGFRSLTTYLHIRTWMTKCTFPSPRPYSTKPPPSRHKRTRSEIKVFPPTIGVSTSKSSKHEVVPPVNIPSQSDSGTLEPQILENTEESQPKTHWRVDPDAAQDMPTVVKKSSQAFRNNSADDPDRSLNLGGIMERNRGNSPEVGFWILAGWVLRHTARSFGYGVTPDGFVRISDILRFPPFKHLDGEKFAKLIYEDPMKRFEVAFLPDFIEGRLQEVWWARAKALHSIPGVSAMNQRILNMGKLKTVLYRTYPENWEYIRKHGIPEGAGHVIRLHKEAGGNLFTKDIPEQSRLLCVTIDCERAASLGVSFYTTNDVRLYAIGVPHRGVIPLEACRSAVLLDISKRSLK